MAARVRAAVLVEIGRIELQEFDRPSIGPAEGLLKVELCGVCGSDPGWYRGKVKLPALPLILGHEIVGRIEEIGPTAAEEYGVQPGDRVIVESTFRCNRCRFCLAGSYQLCDNPRGYGTRLPTSLPPSLWGAYAEYLYLAPHSVVHKIPETITAELGVLICSVIANGLRWVHQVGRAGIGETVVVQGAGQQGLAAVVAAREAGAARVIVTGLTVDADRFALARLFGATDTVNVEVDDPVEVVRELTSGRMADLVIDVSGSREAIERSIDLVAKRGRIVQAGLTGTGVKTGLPLDELVFKEVELLGVYTSTAPAVEAAIGLVQTGKYPLRKMITHRFPLELAEEAVRTVGREFPERAPIKVVLDPGR